VDSPAFGSPTGRIKTYVIPGAGNVDALKDAIEAKLPSQLRDVDEHGGLLPPVAKTVMHAAAHKPWIVV
jgi:hypothetical protein